ncbi:DUF5590 domain-containing protein [Alkalihalobacillus pseudalcaliphilus]|uniref:cell wall elongation regulator TseB-like domain-containing protein n=1 Tax=Alkalihalobacillus pseudalcaliphilus TaxID=79884 RepID=UPI00064DC6D8|nr:DUF5590 domain-containing protein [Alkalihalobacillus pseudalcaliphilus]KMK76406.1 hypothetical protein AB990_14545 [Alkalihalobacillus pseudalcaliphilus]
MKKWFVIGMAAVLILSAVCFIYFYNEIRKPLVSGYEQALAFAHEEQLITEVEDIDYYHGTDTYFVLTGLDEDGDPAYAWIKDDYESYHVEKREDGISVDAALSIVEADYGTKEIIEARLGFERNVPAYEVLFIDDEDRQSYYYVTFDDGTFMKRYHLNRD